VEAAARPADRLRGRGDGFCIDHGRRQGRPGQLSHMPLRRRRPPMQVMLFDIQLDPLWLRAHLQRQAAQQQAGLKLGPLRLPGAHDTPWARPGLAVQARPRSTQPAAPPPAPQAWAACCADCAPLWATTAAQTPAPWPAPKPPPAPAWPRRWPTWRSRPGTRASRCAAARARCAAALRHSNLAPQGAAPAAARPAAPLGPRAALLPCTSPPAARPPRAPPQVAEARPARLLLEQGVARVRQSLVLTAQRPLRDKPLTVQVGAGRARGAPASCTATLALDRVQPGAAEHPGLAKGGRRQLLCALRDARLLPPPLPPAGVSGLPGPAQHQLL
jgi:hypothetical protein